MSSGGGGARAIIAALSANLGIALTKFLAFVLSGSSSMLAEAIHSVADSANQLLLLVGGARSRREATRRHPFGYGRERYIYAFIVSVVLFSVGGLFAIYEGVHKLQHPEPITGWRWLPVAVLVISMGLEGFSFRTAVHEINQLRSGSWFQFIRHARAPELPAVLLEDSAALIGLVLALLGVALTLATGDGVWDALGTLAIGVLLGVVAAILATETKSLLIGESATSEQVEAIESALLAGDEVDRVIHLRTLHLGPEELLVAAKVSVPRESTAAAVAAAIDAAELRIRSAVPIARVIYLEPDIYREPAVTADPGNLPSTGAAPQPGAGPLPDAPGA